MFWGRQVKNQGPRTRSCEFRQTCQRWINPVTKWREMTCAAQPRLSLKWCLILILKHGGISFAFRWKQLCDSQLSSTLIKKFRQPKFNFWKRKLAPDVVRKLAPFTKKTLSDLLSSRSTVLSVTFGTLLHKYLFMRKTTTTHTKCIQSDAPLGMWG